MIFGATVPAVERAASGHRFRADAPAGYRSITGTARLHGKSDIEAIRELTEGRCAPA